MLSYIPTIVIVAYYTLVLGLAAVVILDNRNPAKTLAYLLVLLFVPVIGLVVYVMFGQNIRKQKLFSKKGILDNDRINQWRQNRILAFEQNLDLAKETLHEKVKVARLLLNNTGSVVTMRNEIQVMHETSISFDAIFEDIAKAKHHVHVEFYIVEDDQIGSAFKDLLIRKAQEGVEVRLCVDDLGSRKLPDHFKRELKQAGVQFHVFMRVFFPYLTSRANFRNHRKIVVVDGKIGYIGGINIADRYTNKRQEMQYWRDTQLRLYGESVKNLQMEFMLNWRFVSKKLLPVNDKYYPAVYPKSNHFVQINSSGPDSDWPSIMQAILMGISTAEERIYISTPYFIPNDELITALQSAAMGGIDVQIIVPHIGDSIITQAASMSYVKQMLEAGVKVHRYTKGFIHAKTVVVDDVLSTIGTTNMDYRSFSLNFEINAFVYDREVAKNMVEQFELDRWHSEEFTLARWEKRARTKRIVESLARMLAPLL